MKSKPWKAFSKKQRNLLESLILIVSIRFCHTKICLLRFSFRLLYLFVYAFENIQLTLVITLNPFAYTQNKKKEIKLDNFLKNITVEAFRMQTIRCFFHLLNILYTFHYLFHSISLLQTVGFQSWKHEVLNLRKITTGKPTKWIKCFLLILLKVFFDKIAVIIG